MSKNVYQNNLCINEAVIHSNNLINQPYLVQRRQKKRKSLSTKFGLEYHGIQGIIPRVLIA